MVREQIELILISYLGALGLPFLLILLFLKGLLIGKPIPTSIVIPGYILVTGLTGWEIAGIVVITAMATTTGQTIIYWKCTRSGTDILEPLPFLDKNHDRVQQATTYFEKHGAVAIFMGNIIPGFRGLMAIPAGVSKYPFSSFVVTAYCATLCYHFLIATIITEAVRSLS